MSASVAAAVVAGTTLVSLAAVPAAPAQAAVDHVTDASEWLMQELLKLERGTQNGGIYAAKKGYHNTRDGNLPGNYSVRDAEDQGGPSDKAAAYDWTFPEAQPFAPVSDPESDAQPVPRLAPATVAEDYSGISKYSKRLLASGRDSADPRLNGWREFYGQADNDNSVEGYDFRYDENVSSDDSHLWHIHLSEDRDKVTSLANKEALLSVLRGETVEQWRNKGGAKPRIGVVTTAGVALVKEGGLSTSWVAENTGIQQVVLAGDRIGVLTTGGQALVKEGTLSAGWTSQYSNVRQLVLAGKRIGVVTTDGVARVKEGDLDAGWTTVYSNVQQLELAGDRIGVLTTAGTALVKDGGLSASWDTQYTGVQQIALMANRIGVLTTAGEALVKDGNLDAGWVSQYLNVQQLTLGSDRVGVITTDGLARVKDGSLSAGWTVQYANVQQLALAADRIGVLTTAGVALVKDGDLNASWVNERTAVQRLSLS